MERGRGDVIPVNLLRRTGSKLYILLHNVKKYLTVTALATCQNNSRSTRLSGSSDPHTKKKQLFLALNSYA